MMFPFPPFAAPKSHEGVGLPVAGMFLLMPAFAWSWAFSSAALAGMSGAANAEHQLINPMAFQGSLRGSQFTEKLAA